MRHRATTLYSNDVGEVMLAGADALQFRSTRDGSFLREVPKPDCWARWGETSDGNALFKCPDREGVVDVTDGNQLASTETPSTARGLLDRLDTGDGEVIELRLRRVDERTREHFYEIEKKRLADSEIIWTRSFRFPYLWERYSTRIVPVQAMTLGPDGAVHLDLPIPWVATKDDGWFRWIVLDGETGEMRRDTVISHPNPPELEFTHYFSFFEPNLLIRGAGDRVLGIYLD